MSTSALASVLKRDRLVILASLIAVSLLAWLFLLHLAAQMEAMQGMAARMMSMPVEDPVSGLLASLMSPAAAAAADAAGNFILIALMWAVMMAGMMLPSAAPTILLFAALERRRHPARRIGGRTAFFVAGYLLLWIGFSIGAAALQTALAHAGLVTMEMTAATSVLAGAIFVAAGVYEFTPSKEHCLAHCRSPMEWLPRHWRPGHAGALRMGAEHGAYCVGCCWVLMLLLFAVGVMNLLWVAAIAALVLAQKLFPAGRLLSRIGGIVLMAWGTMIALNPV